MDIHSPMITEGWSDLISFYADKSDKLVLQIVLFFGLIIFLHAFLISNMTSHYVSSI